MNGEAIAPSPRRAIFGGTFNPIHNAHLEIAQAAQQQFHLDEIIWVPTIAPHYKLQVAPFEQRLVMVKLAIAPYPNFTLANLSAQYAIDIFTALQLQNPSSVWFWLIGLDAFRTVPRWVDRAKLAAACEWLIAPRGEFAADPVEPIVTLLQAEGIAVRWQWIERSPSPISSSLVRDRCQAILPIAKFVPMPVQTYIQEHGLYRGCTESDSRTIDPY